MDTPRTRAPSRAALRIAELEAELKLRDEKLKELTTERDQARELVDQMREHVEDAGRMIEQWIEVFEMDQDENGRWLFNPNQSRLWEQHTTLLTEHNKLIREWNRFTGEYNAVVAPRERGRPLAASAAQQSEIAKRRKAGESLRTIAAALRLSVRAVRTVIDKTKGNGRPGKRTNDIRRRELNRLRAAAFRARKKSRDQLPQQIAEQLKTGADLIKAAKGLGR
jgi:hypothetical protein